MARVSRPWFRASKDAWYCTMEGRKVSLKVKGEANEAEAVRAWHRLFAGMPLETPEMPLPSPIVPQTVPMVKAEPKAEAVSVKDVVQGFLGDCEGRVKRQTLRCYRVFLLPFAEAHKGKASDLTPTQAEMYSRKPQWSDATRADFLGALIAAVRWAVRARLLSSNPLQGVRVPHRPSRGVKALISQEEYESLLKVASPSFGLFLRVLWAVGCRPGEVAAITAENFDADAGLVRLTDHKTAHKGKRRVLYLPPDIVALLKQQKEHWQQGALLRTLRGNAWEISVLVKTMIRTRKRANLPHATLYGFRHSFATDALANGVPDAQVAELLGHSGTTMLHKHYSHLGARAQALRDALAQVR